MPQYLVPSQFSDILYQSFNVSTKCIARCFLLYFTPKLSTTRLNHTGCHLCFHNPGVWWHGLYPFVAKRSVSNLFARMPACIKPYIPFCTSRYTHLLCTNLCNSYSFIISSGIIPTGSHIYSYRSIGVPK